MDSKSDLSILMMSATRSRKPPAKRAKAGKLKAPSLAHSASFPGAASDKGPRPAQVVIPTSKASASPSLGTARKGSGSPPSSSSSMSPPLAGDLTDGASAHRSSDSLGSLDHAAGLSASVETLVAGAALFPPAQGKLMPLRSASPTNIKDASVVSFGTSSAPSSALSDSSGASDATEAPSPVVGTSGGPVKTPDLAFRKLIEKQILIEAEGASDVDPALERFASTLAKRSHASPKKWLIRHFKYESSTLSYAHTADSAEPSFSIHVANILSVVKVDARLGKFPFTFKIMTRDGFVVECAAASAGLMDTWIRLLRRALAKSEDRSRGPAHITRSHSATSLSSLGSGSGAGSGLSSPRGSLPRIRSMDNLAARASASATFPRSPLAPLPLTPFVSNRGDQVLGIPVLLPPAWGHARRLSNQGPSLAPLLPAVPPALAPPPPALSTLAPSPLLPVSLPLSPLSASLMTGDPSAESSARPLSGSKRGSLVTTRFILRNSWKSLSFGGNSSGVSALGDPPESPPTVSLPPLPATEAAGLDTENYPDNQAQPDAGDKESAPAPAKPLGVLTGFASRLSWTPKAAPLR